MHQRKLKFYGSLKKPSGTLKRISATNRRIEMDKMIFDSLKHITTLTSGAVLILIALLEKVLRTRPSTIELGIVLGFFLFSIVCAVATMVALALNAGSQQPTCGERKFVAAGLAISWTCFGLGLGLVAINAIRYF